MEEDVDATGTHIFLLFAFAHRAWAEIFLSNTSLGEGTFERYSGVSLLKKIFRSKVDTEV